MTTADAEHRDPVDPVALRATATDDVHLLRRALEAAGTGLWELDPDSGIVHMSTLLQRMLGAPSTEPLSAEILGAQFAPDDAEGVRAAVDEALESDGSICIDVRIQRFDGERCWLQIAGTVQRHPDTGQVGGSGIAIDITERKRTEQRLSVSDAVARVIARADTLDEALPDILAAMAAGAEMDICTLWLPSTEADVLTCVHVHVMPAAQERCERFVRLTTAARFRQGDALPGYVWQTREATWLETIAPGTGFGRAEAAMESGLASGGAIPLLAGSVFVGVVELFASRPTPLDEPLLETLSGLGREVGQFVQRTRAEARLRANGARQRLLVEVLQKLRDAPDADSVMRVTSEALCRHLRADRVGFHEIRDEHIVTLAGWGTEGHAPLDGRWPLESIGRAFLDEVASGRPIAFSDSTSDPRLDGTHVRGIEDRAGISVPMLRGGHWSGGVYVHADAGRVWTRAEISLVREVAEHAWDAVERLRAEVARQESEALARTIADNSTQALVLMDQRGYVRFANAACLEMTGYEGDEIRARPLHELIHHHHPDGRPYPIGDCPIDRALPELVAVREHEDVFFRKDGSAFPVHCAASPVIRSGLPDATIIEIRDVSASQAAARALAESEQRFRGTFENAAVGMAHVALDGRWVRVNRRLCEFTGYSEPELLARTFQDITHPDDLKADLEQVDAVLRGDLETYSMEKRYLRRDGEAVWGELTVSLERGADGMPDYFIAVISDVAARKLAESRLKAALAVKEDFLGLVSHELRTPMTVILGLSDVLASGRVDQARASDIASDIADSARELNDLIESMLLLARIDKDEQAAREPAVLRHVAEEAVARQRTRHQSRRYEVVGGDGSMVEANPGLLDRVITNLLVNAAKYSVAEGDIRVVLEATDAEVRVHVIDAGPGLSDAELAQVFEPFYRASETAAAPGIGLGLSVVNRIVESLGGRTWAQGHEGGSDFGFALPRHEPEDG